METQSQAKSKLRRQRDDNDSDQRKSQRLASSAEAERKTKIIDLNDDCLIKVFGYLNLQCLFNVAIANEWLRPAARDVYTRKFGMKEVRISGCDDFRRNTRASARSAQPEASVLKEHNWHNDIDIIGLKQSLLYLRCFGPAITNLSIDYNESKSKRYHYVHQYINDYCAATLTRIIFMRMPNIEIEQFQKVFVRVEDVDFCSCLWGMQLSHALVECFPNVRRLKTEYMSIGRSVGIKKTFKYLEHLEIINCKERTVKQLNTDLLQGVHQLKTLEIERIDVDDPKEPIAALLDMIKTQPQITKLAYNFRSYGAILVSSMDVQRIVAEHATLIMLRLPDYRFTVEDVFTLIRQLNSLKLFEFQINGLEYAKFVAQLDDSKWKIDRRYHVDFYSDLGTHDLITLIRKNVE